MPVPENLRNIAHEIRESGQPQADTVRTLLSWFGHQRRGRWVVSTVRSALREVGLRTDPSFETAYLDGSVVFTLEPDKISDDPGEPVGDGSDQAARSAVIFDDAVARIRMLPAANRLPVTVTRDSRVAEAVTTMMMNDYSQLPVMQNERDLDGLVSWRSIGRNRVRHEPPEFVRECMEAVEEIDEDTRLLEAIARVAEHEVVLVRGGDNRITGIVTTSDLSLQFHELARPFLLLSEIENQIRRLIDGRFTTQDLVAARHPADEDREVETVADLTFGEYGRLLEVPDNWRKLGLDLDRGQFVARLNKVRGIRNEIMHFSPDGISPEDLDCLRDTAQFLRQVC